MRRIKKIKKLMLFLKILWSLIKRSLSLVRSKNDDYIIVADGGQFGSSSLNNNKGSIFYLNYWVLRPIILII